jgi:hypothetical protein
MYNISIYLSIYLYKVVLLLTNPSIPKVRRLIGSGLYEKLLSLDLFHANELDESNMEDCSLLLTQTEWDAINQDKLIKIKAKQLVDLLKLPVDLDNMENNPIIILTNQTKTKLRNNNNINPNTTPNNNNNNINSNPINPSSYNSLVNNAGY